VKPNAVRLWARGARANFLLLPVALVLLGTAAAQEHGAFIVWRFWLTLAGVSLAHIAVNLFNEYSDWRTGIDALTVRTPFSGGSGNLPAGLLQPGRVRIAAWLASAAACGSGLVLALVSGWPVLAFMAVGGFAVVFYTDLLAKWMAGELFSGIALGSLVVIGAYYVQAGAFSPEIVWLSVPPGLLTMLLLFLNEFPDMEADRAGGRRHLVIALGRKRAGYLYAVLLAAVYACIGAGIAAGLFPTATLIGFATVPLALAAAFRAVRYAEVRERFLPALGMNVAVVLATDFLLAAGYLLP
jgi:1,4-dihydroxy-2-naphthoate octaprenyltransferase